MRTFQELILTLQDYWSKQGCALLQPFDMEVGAGTSHVATCLRAIGPEPWRAAARGRREPGARPAPRPDRAEHLLIRQTGADIRAGPGSLRGNSILPDPPGMDSLKLP